LAEALPLSGLLADAFQRMCAILVFTDLAMAPQPPEELLSQVFGLTPAEARLTARLAAGTTLRQAAEALTISRETARSQLKTAFAKTDTHRQADLVSLLMRIGVGRAPS
jgi:DNA-binding CsgD family transcriptional regulator